MVNVVDTVALVRRSEELDVAVADLASVREQLVRLAKVEAWVAARRIAAKRRLDELNNEGVTVWPERDLADVGNTSRREAEQVTRRQHTLDELPAMGDALEAGTVAPAHVDALHRALAPLSADDRARVVAHDGERLVDLAMRTTPEQYAAKIRPEIARAQSDGGIATFERQRRANRLRTWTDRMTGMVHLSGELDPESGAKLVGRLRTMVEERFHDRLPDSCPDDPSAKQDHLRALALIALVDGHSSAAGRPDLIVVVDEHTLRSGLHEQTIIDIDGDTVLPVETLRRLACLANIVPVVLNSDGVALDAGYGSRLATPAQRRALRAMYPTCGVHGCRVPFQQCTIHHIRYWENGGPTDLANLLPLCTRHHHCAHEGRWQLTLHPTTRVLTVTYPDGTVEAHAPPRARAA